MKKKQSTLKGKNLLPLGAFFPFRVDPFPEGNKCTEKQTKSHDICILCAKKKKKKKAENLPSISIHLRCFPKYHLFYLK